METVNLLGADDVPWTKTVKLNQSFAGKCVVSGDDVPPGEPTVMLCSPDGNPTQHYVSLGAVDELAGRLDSLDHDGGRTQLGDQICAMDDDAAGITRDRGCVVCRDNDVAQSEWFVGVAVGPDLNPEMSMWDAILHPDCIDELCAALARVWEHDDLLPQMI